VSTYKGKGHQMNIFWNAFKMKSVLYVNVYIVLNFQESSTKILFQLSFVLVARFFPVHILGWLSKQIQDHGRLSKQEKAP
jgi:hypothetical protein